MSLKFSAGYTVKTSRCHEIHDI